MEFDDTNPDAKRQKVSHSQDTNSQTAVNVKNQESTKCPYLHTVNRSTLDFDFEKSCSVTMARTDIYVCLVCGLSFQGKNRSSPAYQHSLTHEHHVYLNVHKLKFYCLPDNYQIEDSSLDDIIFNINPTFSKQMLHVLFSKPRTYTASNGKHFLTGFLGLKNLNNNSWLNVVIQLLIRIKPIRDHLLLSGNQEPHTLHSETMIHSPLQLLVRKLFNPYSFRHTLSPFSLLSTVERCSRAMFQLSISYDPYFFLMWLLNTIHKEQQQLAHQQIQTQTQTQAQAQRQTTRQSNIQSQKHIPSPVFSALQGRIQTVIYKSPTKSTPTPTNLSEDESHTNLASSSQETIEYNETTNPFLLLSLPLPDMPMFPDQIRKEMKIPEVSLASLLDRFNGQNRHACVISDILPKGVSPAQLKNNDEILGIVKNQMKSSYFSKSQILTNLPPYLIFRVERFIKTEFAEEKNRTRVIFPLQELDMAPYYEEDGITYKEFYGSTEKDRTIQSDELSNTSMNSIEHIMTWPDMEIKKRLDGFMNRIKRHYTDDIKKEVTMRRKKHEKYNTSTFEPNQDYKSVTQKRELAILLYKTAQFYAINVKPYIKQNIETKYNLTSIICHQEDDKINALLSLASGSATANTTASTSSESMGNSIAGDNTKSNHYINYVLNEQSNIWYEIDDTEIKTDEIMEKKVIASEAYILLYKRIDQ